MTHEQQAVLALIEISKLQAKQITRLEAAVAVLVDRVAVSAKSDMVIGVAVEALVSHLGRPAQEAVEKATIGAEDEAEVFGEDVFADTVSDIDVLAKRLENALSAGGNPWVPNGPQEDEEDEDPNDIVIQNLEDIFGVGNVKEAFGGRP